ncbi:MAG: sensor domain-containing diguanylate cyclase [Bacillota bacterium]|nr:sensor domain-containing diguanylate cyclase [Bacillota bacterium]
MELVESGLVLQLKSCFFDMIDPESRSMKVERVTNEMLCAVKNVLNAEKVSLYLYDEWKHEFHHESTAADAGQSNGPSFLVNKRLNPLQLGSQVYRNSLPFEGLEEFDLLIEIMDGEKIAGFLVIKEKAMTSISFFTDDFFEVIGKQCYLFLEKCRTWTKVSMEETRYKLLYRVTEKFHSSMDMDDVLGEIIMTLQEVYPSFTYYLLLSQDNHNHSQLPIKDLEYDSENIAAMQAYLTGTTQFEDSLLERRSILYAPLKGKQGVYGVLQVNASNTLVFPKDEVEFITLLADTAGSALENAQLYQQSRRLISDLQLINETSHRLNSNLRLSETINYMCEQISSSFLAHEVGFFMISNVHADVQVLPGSTKFFWENEAAEYINYLMAKIQRENDSLFIGDLILPEKEAKEMKFRSVMAVPMVQSDTIKGFSIVLHEDPYYFSFETFKLLQSLIHHSTLAFTNSMLREELEKMIITDHLTKLHSRNYLDERIQRAMLEDDQGTFILIDIDNFKVVNDQYGHQIGDEVLVQVANLIKGNIRGSDVGARWGGEELAIYLPKITLNAGVAIAERLVERVADSTAPQVTISCGISFWNRDRQDSFKRLFKRADEALYIAKNSGKNRVITQKDTIPAY